MQHRARAHNQGFSLVQISVLIAVAGIILASVLPGGDFGSDVEKERITRERMEKIEEATQAFMATHLRRPCPADGIALIEDGDAGVEKENPGTCSNGNFIETPPFNINGDTTEDNALVESVDDMPFIEPGMLVTSSNLLDQTHVLSINSPNSFMLNKIALGDGAPSSLAFTSVTAGTVPTRTLGLPDDYMFDGYGRRFNYMVDLRATDATLCRDMQHSGASGNVRIYDTWSTAPPDPSPADKVMWALISYGKDGYGAYSMSGSATRLNTGSTDTDQQINAFVNTSASFTTTFTAVRGLVRKAKTATFDDTVWTLEKTKNTCCVGKMCDANTLVMGSTDNKLGDDVATGDINGDGIPDIITWRPIPGDPSASQPIRVIFGRKDGWASAGSSLIMSNNPASSGSLTALLNESRFITISNNSGVSNFAGSVAVGDLNADTYDDIAIGYGNGSNSYIKVFYGSANPASTGLGSISDVITFPNTTLNGAPKIVMGKFAHTNHKDILALVKTASGTGNSSAYVIYGAASYAMTAESTSTLAASNGFKILTTSPGRLEAISATGDLNNDGHDDILFSNYTNTTAYILFGQLAANWNTDKTTPAGGGQPDRVNIDTRVTAGANEAMQFTGSSNLGRYTLRVANMNPTVDSIGDLVINNGNYIQVYYGKASWTTPINLDDPSSLDATVGFRIDTATDAPSMVATTPLATAVTGDVNGDGADDLVITDSAANVNGYSGNGTSFVLLQPNGGWNAFGDDYDYTLFGDIFNTDDAALPLSSSYGFRIDGITDSTNSNLKAIADINNDGMNDLIVGIPAYQGVGGDEGMISILFGHKYVPWPPVTDVNTPP